MKLDFTLVSGVEIEWNIDETKVRRRKEPTLQMDLKVLWQTPIQRQ